MSLSFGKRDRAKIAEVLDGEYDSAEDAAEAVIEAVVDLYESKAKWTVVGQLLYRDGAIDPESPAASKVALGRYGTETQALAAAHSLAYSNSTHEMFRTWALPVWHGTPASFFKARKKSGDKAGTGITQTDRFRHEFEWRLENPDKTYAEYPGPPGHDPRADCPICGSSTDLEGGE